LGLLNNWNRFCFKLWLESWISWILTNHMIIYWDFVHLTIIKNSISLGKIKKIRSCRFKSLKIKIYRDFALIFFLHSRFLNFLFNKSNASLKYFYMLNWVFIVWKFVFLKNPSRLDFIDQIKKLGANLYVILKTLICNCMGYTNHTSSNTSIAT